MGGTQSGICYDLSVTEQGLGGNTGCGLVRTGGHQSHFTDIDVTGGVQGRGPKVILQVVTE